ncbi:hypothetical protein FQA47_024447 [Oryzias melastigma]|uniref:Uncharacterized protein n=1 Tax=Oryzias melastigma TaxID=30732 RepID=A0A834FIT4_ORYME|nr:hypothetical protein FQA47_024447 [Oryzias melastigma]
MTCLIEAAPMMKKVRQKKASLLTVLQDSPPLASVLNKGFHMRCFSSSTNVEISAKTEVLGLKMGCRML